MKKTIEQRICDAGRLMFKRRLTDLAGGNISARDGEIVHMSPTLAGQRYHWDLTPDLLLSGRWASDELVTDKRFSREGWAHLLIYRNFPDVNAVIHAHPMNVMPFTAIKRSIEPVLEGTRKFNTIGFCEEAPGHTRELAEKVVIALQDKTALIKRQAAAVLIPFHGIILAGQDFDKTLDALERVDQNAYCILNTKLLNLQ